MSDENSQPFSFPAPNDYRRFRDIFTEAGYSDSGVLDTLGVKDFSAIRGADLPMLMRRTEQGRPLDTLIRLFLMEVPVTLSAAKQAFTPMDFSDCVSAGLISPQDSEVIARVKLLPFKGMLIAFDQHRMLHSKDRARYVMGIGASSLTLSNLTLRNNVRRSLDLGTGCGVQALMAARHSDQVVASDKNDRAVRLAAFNARVNGFSHVNCLLGDLFDPFDGQAFDLVVANPPFVISPETRYIYRDGGMAADRICRRIVREVPRYLTEGGFCQMLCNWAETAKEPWEERLRQWVEGTGCDMSVLCSESRDAATYATTWIRHTEPDISPAEFARRFDAWMAYYEGQGIVSVSAGLITLRRGGRTVPHFLAEQGPEKMIGPCGEDILYGFTARDFLSSVQENKDLFDKKFKVSDDVDLVRRASPGEDGWVEKSVQLQRTQGMVYTGNIDSFVANLLIGCNGIRPLRVLLTEMATAMGVDDSEKIAAPLADVVRGLVTRGFLRPVSIG